MFGKRRGITQASTTRGAPRFKRGRDVEFGWDPHEMRRWQDIPEQRAKFTSIELPELGHGPSHEAEALILRLKALGNQRRKDDISLKMAQRILLAKKQAEAVNGLLVKVHDLEGTLGLGYFRQSNVEPGFTNVRKGPTTTRPMVWWRGERTMWRSINRPANRTNVPGIFSRIPVVGKIIGGQIDEFIRGTVNAVTWPARKIGSSQRQAVESELADARAQLHEAEERLRAFSQGITRKHAQAYDRSMLRYVHEVVDGRKVSH